MAYQLKEGQGSLFRNDKQNDRQPDFRGSILIGGVTYNISAWNRTSQNGREYISMQAEERRQDAAPQDGSPYAPQYAPQGAGTPRQAQPYGPVQRGYSAPQPAAAPYQAPQPAPAPAAPEAPAPDADDFPGDDLPF